MLVSNSLAGTLHVEQTLDFNLCSVTFSIWSATYGNKIGKHLRTFLLAYINWDAIKGRVLQGRKNEFEYVLQRVGVYLFLVSICFCGL